MTLSPVFRSDEAVRELTKAGLWNQLAPAAQGQADAIATVRHDLPEVLDAGFIDVEALANENATFDLEFVQEFFFLILFRSVLETVGVGPAALTLCSELNFCIKGTITAADNLFDDQNKTLLPLKAGEGARFNSILQLLAFERLAARALQRGIRAGSITERSAEPFQRELLSRMAAIGSLEGSEEHGVAGVLPPDVMIDQVHRVRGGALFELAFVAPRLLAVPSDAALLGQSQQAIAKLGTAFQIVDDLTDLEIDFARGSHNLLISQITHCGTPREQASLTSLEAAATREGDVVTDLFAHSARAVIERGEIEARTALEELQALGFWFPPALSDQLIRAIVGLDGVERMRAL